MHGGARPGAGRPRKPLIRHYVEGTWRRSRHGVPPTTGATVLALPTPAAAWVPGPAELAGLESAGQALVGTLLAQYDFTAAEGPVVIEAGHVADRLAALRRVADPSPRLEMAWIRLLAALLSQLRAE
jgi:hypothetical protein